MKIELRANAKNLTPYSGLYPLLKFVNSEAIPVINENVFLKSKSMDKIKEKHILSCLALEFIGGEKINRIKLLQKDPLLKKVFGLNVTNPENISRFLKKFDFESTAKMELVNMTLAKKAIKKAKLKHITVDIDSSVKNVEGHQEGAEKGYNPENKGNKCYNIQFAFCEEIKVFVGGYLRSGDTNTCNGAEELVKSIVSMLGDSVDEITFRFDSGYFSEKIVETIESLSQKYVIRAKGYSTLVSKLRKQKDSIIWQNYKNGKETAVISTKPNNWEKERQFIVSREKDENLITLPIDSFDGYDYYFFVTNQETWTATDVVWFYEKRGNSENHIKESKYDFSVKSITLNSFWGNQALFQLQMMAYNILILFKLTKKVLKNELRETAKTFRLKYMFVCGKIIFGQRKMILDLSKDYTYKEEFFKLCS